MAMHAIQRSGEVLLSSTPVTAIPTTDDRIYAVVVVEKIFGNVYHAACMAFEACILKPVYDLLETIQILVVSILHKCSSESMEGQVRPVGIKNLNNNCWAIAPMQIVMNSPWLQRQILEGADPQLESLRNFIRQYNDDQACGRIFSREIDSNALRACILHTTESTSSDPDHAWNFILAHIPTPPPKYSVQESPGATFTEGLSGLFLDPNSIGLPEGDMLVYFDRGPASRTAVDERIMVYGNRYDCESFIVHTGNHFLSYVKKPDGKWWFCDDLIVRRASQAEVTRALATSCIHYYTKFETVVPAALRDPGTVV